MLRGRRHRGRRARNENQESNNNVEIEDSVSQDVSDNNDVEPNGNANQGRDNVVPNQQPNMQMFQDFMNFIQATAAQNQPARNNDNNTIIEQFRRYHPSTLKGREGPLATEEWLRGLDRIFLYITCTEVQKVSCASFQLVEDAGHWWESVSHNITVEQRNGLTWEQLKEMIMEQYFLQSFRDQKEKEFLNLQQGGMSVVDYERKFNQLSRYATHLVDTEPKKARRFELGLRPEISGILACTDITTYADAV